MTMFRRLSRAKDLSKYDRLSFSAPSLNGYEIATIKYQPTRESFVISLVDGKEAVLKSYNTYRFLSNSKIRPYLPGVEAANIGTQVRVKRADDGDFIGILERETVGT